MKNSLFGFRSFPSCFEAICLARNATAHVRGGSVIFIFMTLFFAFLQSGQKWHLKKEYEVGSTGVWKL